jgi:hypothetical protein
VGQSLLKSIKEIDKELEWVLNNHPLLRKMIKKLNMRQEIANKGHLDHQEDHLLQEKFNPSKFHNLQNKVKI